MSRRRVLVNVGLGVVVLALGVAGVAALLSPRTDPLAAVTLATVARGTLEATVTASGNVESGRTASLQVAGTGGVVEEVYVATGERVAAGDPLVRVDDTSAQDQLASALVQLRSAEASLTTATQGRTSAERASDAAGVASAEQGLANAETSLSSARDSLALVRQQQSDLVDAAADAQRAAERAVARTSATIDDLKEQLAAADPADAATVANLQAQIDAATAQLAADKASVTSTTSASAQAQRTRDTAIQQAEQAVASQTGARDAAAKTVAQQKAAVAVSQQGPRAGSVESARAQVASAQLAVDQARAAIDDTVLRAPFSGVVSTVNAVVGQSSAAASGAGTATGASAGTGLVTLVDPYGLGVTASIAEADATSVQVGQPANVTLPASGRELTGTVTAVDIQSTVTNNVVQYLTTVALDAPPVDVRVGQTASLTIVTGTRDDVLQIPTSAIATTDGTSRVTAVKDGRLVEVTVTTGMVGTTGTEIVSGLAEGDEVVLVNSADAATTGGFPGGPAAAAATP